MNRPSLVAALAVVTHCALAADNLTCSGPFEEIADAPILALPVGRLDPGQSSMVCPQVLSNAIVAAVACVVEIVNPPEAPKRLRCPLGASCAGVGTFQSIERIKGPMGFDQICVTYVNQSASKATYGIRMTLAR
jgi:hypothetical protein